MACKYHYLHSCVESDAESIHAMMDASRQVTLRTFRKRTASLQWEQSMGYERDGRGGLPLSRDYHVSFHKSVYRGQPCYYATHSAIEHIFIAGGSNDDC